MSASRAWQLLLVLSVLGLSWLGMMAVHELGHVLNCILSGGTVVRVVLDPREISRTDISPNPHPQFVAWGGAVWGTLIPLVAFAVLRFGVKRFVGPASFFAGFCAIANGLYLAVGSRAGVGDAGDLLRHGAATWQLLVFGVPATTLGLWLWNGLGPRFGLDAAAAKVTRKTAIGAALTLAAVVAVEMAISSH